jgi:hypothetical protein
VANEALEAIQQSFDRYLLAVGLLIATVITFASAGESDLGALVGVIVESATLIVILHSSRVSPRILRVAIVVVSVLTVGALFSLTREGTLAMAAPSLIGILLALSGPPAIIRRLQSHTRIDFVTVAGALCIYLLAGLFFAFVYSAIGAFQEDQFFAQQETTTSVDCVYFSFVTLTTVGYGDLTARTDFGRMTAISEALFGQLYLVSVVALLVSNLGRARPRKQQAE